MEDEAKEASEREDETLDPNSYYVEDPNLNHYNLSY